MFIDEYKIGKMYTVISKINEDGSIETKDLKLCEEIVDHYKAECRLLMSDGREYHPWEIYKNRREAIDSYTDELRKIIRVAEKENEKVKKTVEKQTKKIAEMKKELEKIQKKRELEKIKMDNLKYFCEEYGITESQLDKETVEIITSDKVYLPELSACIENHIKNKKPTVDELNEYIKSDDIKFHFGFDVDGWEKIGVDEYLISIGKGYLVHSGMNEIHDFFEKIESDNLFANLITYDVYVKK